MNLLIIAVCLIIIAVISNIIYNNYWNCSIDNLLVITAVSGYVAGFIMLIVLLSCLALKPLDYKKFKVEYELIKEITTYKDDIRDATFTMKVIELNQEIKTCREFIDSKWVGIYYNKKICDAELLRKE